jgi:quercetin dioxygenase-like cupin family protein
MKMWAHQATMLGARPRQQGEYDDENEEERDSFKGGTMQLIEVLSAKRFADEKMQKVSLFDTANCFCDLYCLKPGQSQKPHSHSGADKIYYVIEGEARIQVGDEEQVAGAGRIVLAPSDVVHGVRNASSQPLSLLVFMAPNPNVRA